MRFPCLRISAIRSTAKVSTFIARRAGADAKSMPRPNHLLNPPEWEPTRRLASFSVFPFCLGNPLKYSSPWYHYSKCQPSQLRSKLSFTRFERTMRSQRLRAQFLFKSASDPLFIFDAANWAGVFYHCIRNLKLDLSETRAVAPGKINAPL